MPEREKHPFRDAPKKIKDLMTEVLELERKLDQGGQGVQVSDIKKAIKQAIQ
jgi:hypothetical protein